MKKKINYIYIIIPIILIIVGLIIFIVFINKPKASDTKVEVDTEEEDNDNLTLDTPQEQILYDGMINMFDKGEMKSDINLKTFFKNDFIKLIKCISKSLGPDVLKVPDDFEKSTDIQYKISRELLPNCKISIYMIIILFNLGQSECKRISKDTIQYIQENFPNDKVSLVEYRDKYMSNPSFIEKISKIFETCKLSVQEQVIYDKMLESFLTGKIDKELFLDNFSFQFESYVKCINNEFLSRGVDNINNIEQLNSGSIYFTQLLDIAPKCPISQQLLILNVLILDNNCKQIDRSTLLAILSKYDPAIKFTALEFRDKFTGEFIGEMNSLATDSCNNS